MKHRYSLRSSGIAIFVVALAIMGALKIKTFYQRFSAIDRLKQVNATVLNYDREIYQDGQLRRSKVGQQPKHWSVKQRWRINLSDLPIDAEIIADLRQVDDIIALELDGTTITDQDIAALGVLPFAEKLSLNCTAVSDKIVPALIKWPMLRKLHLSDTNLTDAGVSELRHLRTLQELDISVTKIKGGCFEDLSILPKLEWLNISDNTLDASDVLVLGKFKSLHTLEAYNIESDTSLSKLQEIKADIEVIK